MKKILEYKENIKLQVCFLKQKEDLLLKKFSKKMKNFGAWIFDLVEINCQKNSFSYVKNIKIHFCWQSCFPLISKKDNKCFLFPLTRLLLLNSIPFQRKIR